MDVIVKEIIEEIGDMHSSKLQNWFESIGPMVSKIESLEAIIEDMEEAEANATFQLVTDLPATGKANVYYIKLNTSTNKYEEYKWESNAFKKVGTISDDSIAYISTLPVFHEVDKTAEGYASEVPVTNGWYELVDGDYVLSDDSEVDNEKTYYVVDAQYRLVDSTDAMYASANPKHADWYEYSNGVYSASTDTAVANGKSYYKHL
jgi:hypothetical protein